MCRPRRDWRIVRCAARRRRRRPRRLRATRHRLRRGPRRKSRGSLDATQGLLGVNPTLLTWLMGACFLAGLALVALGLPGLWVMVLAVLGYGWLTDFHSIGLATIVAVVGLAAVGEVIEAWLGFGLA